MRPLTKDTKVQTSDGRRARIICDDRDSDFFPIVALVQAHAPGCAEIPITYTKEGRKDINKLTRDDLIAI